MLKTHAEDEVNVKVSLFLTKHYAMKTYTFVS